jgi:P-type Ca2+ transporter type 2B
MSSSLSSSSSSSSAAAAIMLDADRAYEISVDDLRDMVEAPGEEGVTMLRRMHGGVAGVAGKLRVDLRTGLRVGDRADLAARHAEFGTNRIPQKPQASILALMWDAVQDLTLIILIVAGLASLVLGLALEEDRSTEWIDGAAILFAVLVCTLVAAVNDYQKERQFRKLNAVREDELIKVVRGGMPGEVSIYDVAVGDIVRLEVGDILCADGVLIDGNDLRLDESSLTGESDHVRKDESAPFLFSGTKVMEGAGRMMVVAVGLNSQSGIIKGLILGLRDRAREEQRRLRLEERRRRSESSASSAAVGREDTVSVLRERVYDAERKTELNENDAKEEDEEESVLQAKLERLVLQIGYIGMVAAALSFIVMTTRFSVETFAVEGKSWESDYVSEYLDYFTIAITILVVAIPEGLPLAVTLCQAYSVRRMLMDNNLVRHLSACETMGNATTICSDKTGTLTTNRMTVMRCWIEGSVFDPARDAFTRMSVATKKLIVDAVCVNSTAEILPSRHPGGQPEHTGNKTECALLQFCADAGIKYADLRGATKRVRMNTFSSERKRMSVVADMGEAPAMGNAFHLYIKGASEIVLGRCSSIVTARGVVEPLSIEERDRINRDVIDVFAKDGLRTICVAYRPFARDDRDRVAKADAEELEENLTCLAIFGIEDPLRPEVPGAIATCQQAGIVVRMVTGDNVNTARSIASKCGILTPGATDELVMEGPDFRNRVLDEHGNLKQDEFDQIWPKLRVLARSSPKDKYTLVSGLIASTLFADRQVVAVTGDGTNDGPALKRADVGFAMGLSGTPVAKDASDIILMDDNFQSIVKAVKWGRNVFDSISKFLQFQLTVNAVAVLLAVIGALALNRSPITAVQLLWINLIMDSFASLALATEPPTDALLLRKPCK